LIEHSGIPISSICSIRIDRQRGTAIVRLYGEFDLSGEAGFRDELGELLDSEIEALVLDLRGLTFMDSTGLRVLVSVQNLASKDGFDYTVLCGDGLVRRVLHETGLDGVLPLVNPEGAVPPSDSAV
jgi:anti-sigma B factor antagonist